MKKKKIQNLKRPKIGQPREARTIKPDSILQNKEELKTAIDKLYDAVRQESKDKKAAEPKDQPRIVPKPKDVAIERSKTRQARRNKDRGIEGPTVTLKELAFDNELSAREIRRALRKAKVQRPFGRWEWPTGSVDLEQVLKVVNRLKGK